MLALQLITIATAPQRKSCQSRLSLKQRVHGIVCHQQVFITSKQYGMGTSANSYICNGNQPMLTQASTMLAVFMALHGYSLAAGARLVSDHVLEQSQAEAAPQAGLGGLG